MAFNMCVRFNISLLVKTYQVLNARVLMVPTMKRVR